MSATPDDVSLGEIFREVTRIHARLDNIERMYQPRDLAEAQATNILLRIDDVVRNVADLKKEQKDDREEFETYRANRESIDRANRALVWTSLACPLLVAIIVICVQYALNH